MLAVATDTAPGRLPPTQRGLEMSRKGVQVTAFGANPDGEGTVLRLWELSGKGGSCQVRLPAGMNAENVQPVNLRGAPEGKPLAVKNGTFTASLKTFAPASFVIQARTK
jgi:alpha-mannosidase